MDVSQYLLNRQDISKSQTKKNGSGRFVEVKRDYKYTFDDVLFNGIDYLRVGMSFKENIFSKLDLDSDNNNTLDSFELFGEKFTVLKNRQYLYFSKDGENMFSVRELNRSEQKIYGVEDCLRYYVFDFYGKFFAMEKIGIFKSKDFLQQFTKIFTKAKIYRFDYAFDFGDYAENLCEGSDLGKTSSIDFDPVKKMDNETQRVETLYFGSRSKTNKHAFIRMYDKKKLAMKKHEEVFYPYIFDHKEVFRMEIQFNSGIINDFGILFEDIFSEEKILTFCKGYLQSKVKFFSLDFTSFKRAIRSRYIATTTDKEKYYLSRILPFVESMKKNGVSPKKILKKAEFYINNKNGRIPSSRKC
jgi:hypothetical protein